MAKRRGNPNWGKPEPIGPVIPTVTEFEQVVREYKLSPDQYLRSTRPFFFASSIGVKHQEGQGRRATSD